MTFSFRNAGALFSGLVVMVAMVMFYRDRKKAALEITPEALIIHRPLHKTVVIRRDIITRVKIRQNPVPYPLRYQKAMWLFIMPVLSASILILQYSDLISGEIAFSRFSLDLVYLRDVHGIPPQGYGYILSLNAAMVVFFQFWITRRVSKYAPMLMMALGTAFYGVGFAMYGFVSSFALFMVAMVIITIGEMIIVPVAQALAAQFAPEDMRGRYMAMFGFSWTIPFAIGPLLAGLIMDNYDPHWVWYAAGIVAMVAVGGYLLLHLQASGSSAKQELEPDQLPAASPAYD